MTGWRIGYAAGPQTIMAKMGVVLGHAASNPAAVSQYAAIEAFSGDQSSVETMRQGFEARLNELYPLIERLPGLRCLLANQREPFTCSQILRKHCV